MDGFGNTTGNLLQNPGFECDLLHWVTDNVTSVDTNPAEGTQAARLGTGVASLYQDVPLRLWRAEPLLFSFFAYTESDAVSSGTLVAEVSWLDAAHRKIGIGLQATLVSDVINTRRITYFDVTDRPPLAASWARVLLSKGGDADTSIVLDHFNLTPVGTPNLVQNPGFEQGLAKWIATAFHTTFSGAWENNAAAENTGQAGLLYQDISIFPARPGTSFLLGFAAEASGIAQLSVQLIWLNAFGNPIGAPGIDIFITGTTLTNQGNYLSYLEMSAPAPAGAAKARVLFLSPVSPISWLRIDKVLLARATSPNLLDNPGFGDGLDHWVSTNTVVASGTAYVGSYYAQIASSGGTLYQQVAVCPLAAFHRFLFAFGLIYGVTEVPDGSVIAQVHWLDAAGRELGLGLSLLAQQTFAVQNQWLTYCGITEPAPLGTVGVRVQFTKAAGGTGETAGIDHVLLARMD